MGWVYLDDGFPDHPKVEGLSDGAFRLYLVSLCHARRWNTNGAVGAQLARTMRADTWRRRAAELRAARLWDDAPGAHESFVIHDWADWNRTQQSRSEAGRKAAAARWANARRNANADADAMRIADANASESHMRQDAQSPPYPYNPHPLTTPTSARETDEEDDSISQESPDNPGDLVEAAVTRLALDDLNRRTAQPGLPPVGNRTGWLNQAAAVRRNTDGPALARYLNAHPAATLDDLVSTVARTPTGETPDSRLDGQQTAARRREVEGMAQVEALRSVPIDPQRQDRLTQMRDALRQLPRDGGA